MTTYPVHDFPKTFLTADIVAWRHHKGQTQILFIKRLKEPYKEKWALPGGFFDIDLDDTIENAAKRELEEETSLKLPLENFKLVGVFSKRNRDPREAIATEPCRIVSAAYKVEVKDGVQTQAHDDAMNVKWFDLNELPALSFDHADIIAKAISFKNKNA